MERSETLKQHRNPSLEGLDKIQEKYRNVREIVKSLLNYEPSIRMELVRVITLLSSPLGHQQNVEKARVSPSQLHIYIITLCYG